MDIRALWEEYEHQSSVESVFVKDCDRIEMTLQAFEYEQRTGVKLDSFFESTIGKARLEQTKEWDAEIRRRRDNQTNK